MKLGRKISKREISAGLGGLCILTVQVRAATEPFPLFLGPVQVSLLFPWIIDYPTFQTRSAPLTSPVHLPTPEPGIYLGGSCSYFETKEVKNDSVLQRANLFLWFCELCQTIRLPDFQAFSSERDTFVQ